jgi:glycosyltransferase involved in cell wall biosynthesis
MRIGIDARPLVGPKSGIGHYLEEILLAWAALDTENEYYLFAHTDFELHKSLQGMRKVIQQGRFGPLWIQYAIPLLLVRYKIDLFWGPNYAIPLLNPGHSKMVMTVHDMVASVFPETLPKRTAYHNRIGLPLYIQKVDRVITVSESSKSDIVKYLRYQPDKIEVTPLGVNESFFQQSITPKKILIKYEIDYPYILCVGTIEPRKNLLRVIEAYFMLIKELEIEHRLVIVGAKGWKYTSIYEKLKQKSELINRIIFPGYVPDEDLPAFYQGASMLVYPSLYEGFGLPPLEAMAAGTPVITSNVSSLPEVVGESGILVDPYSICEMVHAMKRIICDKKLAENLSRAGKERARKFTWERTAKKTMDIFEEVMNEELK